MYRTLKSTLYSTAALAAISTGAFAGGLADLKQMIESFRTGDMLSQAAVQMPRGYNVSPSADVTAEGEAAAAVEEPFVEYKVSGYIKAGYIYSEIDDVPPSGSAAPVDNSSDFDVEGGLNVKGSVQSSLGEVGVTIQAKWDVAESLANAATPSLRDEGLIGFWQFADTMKLEMGRGNGGRMENGVDKNTRRIWTIGNRRVRSENAGNGFFDRDMYNGFIGLNFSSGPVTMLVRAHDATRGVTGGAGNLAGWDDDAVGISGKFNYSGEMISLEAAGGYWNQDDADLIAPARQTGVKWLAGVGTELNFIEGIPVSLAAQYGELHNGTQMTKLSGSFSLTLTDTIGAGFGGGWTEITNTPVGMPNTPGNTSGNHEEWVATGGIYYTPMSYLTLGLEADWVDDSRPAISDGYTAAFVTRYAF